MIYSRSTQYAIRAMAFLAAAEPGKYVRNSDIARATGIPLPFLFKITQALARGALVHTSRGRGGGIRLARPAGDISLEDIVVSVNGDDFTRKCLLGLPRCNDSVPCPVHHAWKDLRESMNTVLHDRTLEELALALARKRRRSARGPDVPANARRKRQSVRGRHAAARSK